MAKSKTGPVRTEMPAGMPPSDGRTHVGSYPVHTTVSLGEKKTVTPTQTAGPAYTTPRRGTRQFPMGRTDE